MISNVLVARIWIDLNLAQKGPTMIQRQELGALAKLALKLFLLISKNEICICIWKICLLNKTVSIDPKSGKIIPFKIIQIIGFSQNFLVFIRRSELLGCELEVSDT